MDIDHYQLLTGHAVVVHIGHVGDGHAGHQHAALQIGNSVRPTEGTGQTVTGGRGDIKTAIGCHAGINLTDRLRQRIRHIFAGIVQGIAALVATEIIFVLQPLVHVKAAVGIRIHLLQQQNVAVGTGKNALDPQHIGFDLLLGLRIDTGSAVHKEVRILAQGTVAGIKAHDAQLSALHGSSCAVSAALCQLRMGRRILCHGQVAYQPHRQHNNRQGNTQNQLAQNPQNGQNNPQRLTLLVHRTLDHRGLRKLLRLLKLHHVLGKQGGQLLGRVQGILFFLYSHLGERAGILPHHRLTDLLVRHKENRTARRRGFLRPFRRLRFLLGRTGELLRSRHLCGNILS